MAVKKRVTVDHILHIDDIAGLLKELYENRASIDQFILVYTDQEAVPHFHYDGKKERLIYALEQAKLEIMGVFDEDEE